MTSAEGSPARPGRGIGRVLLLVFGSLGALLALSLLAGGCALVWANETQRDDDGYFTTRTERFSTGTYALTHEDVEVGDLSDVPDWLADRLATIQIRATGSGQGALFVGIGPAEEVDGYLRGVAHEEVTDVDYDPFRAELRPSPGGPPSSPPATALRWAASSTGTGTQVATWELAEGDWSAVVMNADGSRGVIADVELAGKAGWVRWLAFGLLGAGLVIGALAVVMIVFGARSPPGGPDAATPALSAPDTEAAAAAAPVEAAAYPVAVEARLDEPLSRWLWLIKGLLAIPHAIVLALLWIAFAVLTVIAFFAILFTGRYPRSIFDFNVGVLRWTWRVGWYTFGGFGTDRYPPFSLGPERDYPATLEVPYPERLSRGLVLVKSWLLAVPHLLVVGIFTGGVFWGWTDPWPGLIPLLALFAAVALLFRGRYHRDLYELLVGLNRWSLRVAAYVTLMRDEYPPFTLRR